MKNMTPKAVTTLIKKFETLPAEKISLLIDTFPADGCIPTIGSLAPLFHW
jgi:hypothetical protein